MSAKVHLDHAHRHQLLRQMIRIRHFEAKCVELYQAQKILGFLHLYDGEEAVSVGVMAALGPEDAVIATYREHGQAIARGVPMDRLMAEMLGKAEGCCHGRGGSMHIFDRTTRFYGGNAIGGGGLPSDRHRARRQDAEPEHCHGLLFRRWRGRRRRISRKHEPGRAVASARAVRLREQFVLTSAPSF